MVAFPFVEVKKVKHGTFCLNFCYLTHEQLMYNVQSLINSHSGMEGICVSIKRDVLSIFNHSVNTLLRDYIGRTVVFLRSLY